MPKPALFAETFRVPALIAAAAGLILVAGVALIKADEHMGTAHVAGSVTGEQVTQQPETENSASYTAPPAFEATEGAKPAVKPEVKPEAKPEPAPAQAAFVIKRTLPITDPIKYGQWFWNEANAPATGPIFITVDLDARVLSIFRDGVEIGTSAVLLGTQEKPTPLGVFPITQKDQHHVSNLYDAPMPYMMRLTNDGVSIHATNVQNGYASHGCVGVPLGFAQKIFAAVKLGTPVIITRGKQAKVGA
jgi:lipoprotein-anchoring transpeptidase ErfK/SrfK